MAPLISIVKIKPIFKKMEQKFCEKNQPIRFRFTAREDYQAASHKMLLHAIFTTLSLSWGESRDKNVIHFSGSSYSSRKF